MAKNYVDDTRTFCKKILNKFNVTDSHFISSKIELSYKFKENKIGFII